MKKLMTAVAIVCAAAFAQAATVDWSTAKNSFYNADNTAAKGVDVYLVSASGAAFTALVEDLVSGDVTAANITSHALYLDQASTGTTNTMAGVAAGSASSTAFTASQYYDVAFVVFGKDGDKDMVYVSTVAQGQAWGGSEYTQELADKATWTSANYSADRWTEVASIPEPTSGLLLLLGMAGLALRRRAK